MAEKTTRRMTSSHLLARLSGMFETARRRSRERAMLAQLGDRDLADIGIARAMVAYELNQPFWRR